MAGRVDSPQDAMDLVERRLVRALKKSTRNLKAAWRRDPKADRSRGILLLAQAHAEVARLVQVNARAAGRNQAAR